MDDFDLEIKKEFINEALMNLEEAEGSFMELESSEDAKPLLDKIFRLAHNLKGGSRAVGFGDVAEFTHELENLVLKIQRNEVELSPDVVTTLLRSNDRLVEMLSELKEDMSAKFDSSEIIEEIKGWVTGTRVANSPKEIAPPMKAPDQSSETVDAEESENPMNLDLDELNSNANLTASDQSQITDEVISDLAEQFASATATETEAESGPQKSELPSAEDFFTEENTESSVEKLVSSMPTKVPELDSTAPATTEPALTLAKTETPAVVAQTQTQTQTETVSKNKEAKNTGEDEVVRVNLSRIDLLNDYVGELIVLQSVVQQLSQFGNSIKLQASIRQMAKLSKDIQSLSMSLRMLPVKPLVQKLQRVVRDTARALEKEVNFEVIGEQMEIDKSVLDRLSDPLIHILRNAVDHGIEIPADRVQSGKKSAGQVTLSFLNEGNHLVVEVKDNGKGINSEILRQKALEKKIISPNQQLSEKQLVHLIFHPGFSTKAVTSEISGRGVGMDVVKTNVEKIGGQVDVTTQIGQGSHFRLQIPLSLAVIEGLVVTTKSNRYVVPLSQVQETINLKSQKVHSGKLGVGSCFELRGIIVPLFSLDEVLGLRNTELKMDGTVLIVNVEDRPMGLVVFDILRSQQIVVKPLGNGIVAQKGWIGSCVLGDGLPTLILNPVDILSGRVSYNIGDSNEKGASA